MEFAALLSQLIVNILVIIFLALLIILTMSSIKAVNEWRKLAQKIATITFWINLLKKAPMDIFNSRNKKKSREE